MTPVLVLAGGEVKEKDRAAWTGILPPGIWNRSQADLGGQTMLERVVAPLREAASGRVLVAGDVPLPSGCVAVPGGDTLVDTLLNGIAALTPEENRLLLATADIPFLTTDAVRDLLDNAPSADFVYTIVPAKLCRDAFPEMRRTTLRTAEGEFTGGNIVLISPDFVRRNEASIRKAYAVRKNPWGLASLLGMDTIGRVLASRLFPATLPIVAVERAVSRLAAGAHVCAYVSHHPGIGADIDRAEDVALARRALGVV